MVKRVDLFEENDMSSKVKLLDCTLRDGSYICNAMFGESAIKGIIKKFCYLLIIALSVVIDNLTGQSGVIRTLVIYFFVANDGISRIENIAELDIKLPQKLIDALEQIKKKGE